MSAKRIKLAPEKSFLRVPIIFLMAHMLVFYIYVFLNMEGYFAIGSFFDELSSGSWSSILRMHSVLTFLSIETYGYMRDKNG
jgi:hypothetical protein